MKSISNYTETARGTIYEPSDTINAYVLAAGVAQTVTVPTGANIAAFASTGNFFANFAGATAAVPAVSITNGTSPALNPTVRSVDGIASFSIIAPANTTVVVSFYSEI